MTDQGQKDLLTRLADASEEALTRLGSGERVTGAVTTVREQLDSLTQRVRGIDQLEKRLEELERKVDELDKASSATPRKTSSARKPATTEKP